MTEIELPKVALLRTLARTGEARRRREAAGVSASELAAALGVAPSQVSLWERGRIAPRPARALAWLSQLEALTAATAEGRPPNEGAA